jgi:hypothetical protein
MLAYAGVCRDTCRIRVEKLSVQRSGAGGKPITVRTNDKGEFTFRDLHPGLYEFKASRDNFADFAVSNLRVRPEKLLHLEFSMRASDTPFLCQ